MNIILKIKNKLFNAMQKSKKTENLTVEEKKEFIRNLGLPSDLYERSYFQYLCQVKVNSYNIAFKLFYIFLNVISFFAIIILLLVPFSYKNKNNQHIDAVCIFDKSLADRIPIDVIEKYGKIEFVKKARCVLYPKDKKYFLKIWKRYPVSFNFLLKSLLKIGIYRCCLCEYGNIKAIIVANEYSFTSSIMTDFCHYNNIKHINVMHGESIYDLVKTFFYYDECYVWDAFYSDLYSSMGAYNKQFIVSIPPCLIFNNLNSTERIKYKYYMQNQTKEQMIKIKQILESLTDNYMVRPHPLYTNVKDLNEIFDIDKTESSDIEISRSIMETKYIMAWDSTVLLQGYLNGKKVILDNVTNLERSKAVEEGYIMANKGIKLSQII